MDRATIRQKKTGRPVRFELTDQTRMAIDDYLRLTGRKPGQFLFAGRGDRAGLTTRQYARLVQEWVASIGLDPAKFGTHSLRRTKAVLIYRRTGNLRAVQLLLGHSKSESRFDTLVSRWMTPSRSPRRLTSDARPQQADVVGGANCAADQQVLHVRLMHKRSSAGRRSEWRPTLTRKSALQV